jgi:hypothetical protein
MSSANASDPTNTHPNDTLLRQIKAELGSDVDLLKYLPLERVRIERFNDIKSERPTALPVKLHFGQIPNRRLNPMNVAILLTVPASQDKPPEQRYNVFSRLGNLERSMSVAEAIRTVKFASAFRCLKGAGRMESNYLRTVAKYYFIASRVDMPILWTVDATFIKELIAACRLARANLDHFRSLTSSEKDKIIMEDNGNNMPPGTVRLPMAGLGGPQQSVVGNMSQGTPFGVSFEQVPREEAVTCADPRVTAPESATEGRTTSLAERLYGSSAQTFDQPQAGQRGMAAEHDQTERERLTTSTPDIPQRYHAQPQEAIWQPSPTPSARGSDAGNSPHSLGSGSMSLDSPQTGGSASHHGSCRSANI